MRNVFEFAKNIVYVFFPGGLLRIRRGAALSPTARNRYFQHQHQGREKKARKRQNETGVVGTGGVEKGAWNIKCEAWL